MANQDDRIVARVLAGDRNAFALLVRRYQGAIYNLMVRTVREPEQAADLTQDTFLNAYSRLHTYRPGNRFFSWLYTIGMNVARDALRRKARRNRLTLFDKDRLWGQPMAELPPPGGIECRQIDRLAVREALNRLPMGYRELLVLRFARDMEIRELMVVFGLSESAVKMRLHRGMKMLKKLFAGSEDGKPKKRENSDG
jgi:RNA polymerase sigma-70 factor (ECF subfamily)